MLAVASGGNGTDLDVRERIRVIKEGMRDLGWEEGRNLRYDFYFAGNSMARARETAAAIVASRPDVVISLGTIQTEAMHGAAGYSMTSEARCSSVCGMVKPIARAVARLMVRSYLTGACTGSEPGAAPASMRAA